MDWWQHLKRSIRSFSRRHGKPLRQLTKAGTTNVVINQYVTNVYNVTNDNSNNFGTRIEGNVVVKGNLENAFNTINTIDAKDGRNQLGEKLKELHKLIEDLTKNLPADEAEKVSRDLRNLVDEATSKKPRKEWYEISAKGLIEATKTVAKMAAPVTAAVKAVLALLA